MAGLRKASNPFMGGIGQAPPQGDAAPQMGSPAGGATPMQSKDPAPIAAGQQAGGGAVAPRGQNMGQPQAPMAAPPPAPMQPFQPLPQIPPSILAQAGGPLGAVGMGSDLMPGAPDVRRRQV